MKIEQIKASKLKPATYNPRQINSKQYKDLKTSIEKFGLVDPIIVNKDLTVIGGHQRLKICKELFFKDVDCHILNLNKEQEKELNIRLNKSGGEFNMDILANEFNIDELVDWGFKHIELGLNIDKIDDNPYTDKIQIPVYETNNTKPNIKDLYNIEKTLKLVEKINNSKINNKIKDFLILSAQRHIIFNYNKIADYYAHSDIDTQSLMEDLALVIIDFDKAIENGYVKLSEEISNEYTEEYG